MHDVRDRKPAWWLLYASALVLVGLVWLIETSVSSGIACTVLELAAVAASFTVMIAWVRQNRLLIEVDERRRRRAYGIAATTDPRPPSPLDGRVSMADLPSPPSVRPRG